MGFLNEQIDVNIKMSKRVKYFYIWNFSKFIYNIYIVYRTFYRYSIFFYWDIY